MEHQNTVIIHKFFEAYGKRDFEAIKQVLDGNAKWIFPGQNPLSGTKKGVEEIVAIKWVRLWESRILKRKA